MKILAAILAGVLFYFAVLAIAYRYSILGMALALIVAGTILSL